jgi:hypothetical protein
VAHGKLREGQPVLLADEGEVTPHEIGVAKEAILLDGLGR